MNERIKKVTTVIKDKWTGFSKAVKIVIIAIPIAIVAVIVLLAILLNHKNEAVLFSGLTTEEAGEISAAIAELGVTDVKLNGGEIIVPEDQADYLRMQLSIQGFPKTSTNYDIWNDGVDLWSTDSDKAEVARQQREARIEATLRQLSAVQQATANLSIPKTRDYAITTDSEVPTCSVVLKLAGDEELTNGEVRAIFSIVSKSVDGLTNDNISISDTYGREYEWISKEEEAAEGVDQSGVPIARKRFTFQREMENAILSNLDSFMTKIYGRNGYAVNVAARLNYDNKKTTSTEYFPSPDGDNSGVLEQERHYDSDAVLDAYGNVVGTTPNADNSPDYPSIEGLDDGEAYYYKYDELQYDVTNIITEVEKDGYSVDTLSVGVCVNTNELTETDRERIAAMVASAAGTEAANVSVWNTAFALSGNGGGTGTGTNPGGVITTPIDPNRNMLLFLVIALGIILISLLIVSLFLSKSRKRKIRHRQEMALAAAQAAAADSGSSWNDTEVPPETDYNIASLTEEAGKESRETILKREIAEFARTSPDIVANILRNMMREENEK